MITSGITRITKFSTKKFNTNFVSKVSLVKGKGKKLISTGTKMDASCKL